MLSAGLSAAPDCVPASHVREDYCFAAFRRRPDFTNRLHDHQLMQKMGEKGTRHHAGRHLLAVCLDRDKLIGFDPRSNDYLSPVPLLIPDLILFSSSL